MRTCAKSHPPASDSPRPGPYIQVAAAIPGQHLSALISMGYIFGFRKDNAIFFNGLDQNCSV